MERARRLAPREPSATSLLFQLDAGQRRVDPAVAALVQEPWLSTITSWADARGRAAA